MIKEIPTLEEYSSILGLDPETVKPLYDNKLKKIKSGRSVEQVFAGFYEARCIK